MSFRRYRHIDWSEVDRLKELLNAFFKALRAEGFLARQNFSCCGGCGMAELTDVVKKSKKPLKGVVFYHHQDNDSVIVGKGTFLAHSPAAEDADDNARKEVAKLVVGLAKSCGLSAEWKDEDPDNRIWVCAPPKPVPPPPFLGSGI